MQTHRRAFLKTAAAAPLIVSSGAWGANDRVTYGLIGTGNRGGGLNKLFQKAGAQCVALCDVYAPYLEKEAKLSPAGVKTLAHYEDLLALPGLDAVVIATPDHQHWPMLKAALAAGRDVYLEKPLSLNLEQSGAMIAAVRKTDRIVQIGMQRRSMTFIHQAKQLIDDGALGQISMVRAMWNWHFTEWLDNSPLTGQLDWKRFLGNAPDRPLEPRRFRWWRGFWDYSGGNMTDQGTHLMDVVQWMTNSGPPLSAICQGQVKAAPGAEVPTVFSAVFEYPDFLATWTLNYRTTSEFDWSIRFLGEKGSMLMDRHGLRLYADPGTSEAPWSQTPSTEPVKEIPETGAAEAHQANFLECVRSRKEPNCPIEVAAKAVAGPHMANLAYREGRKVKFDSLT
ncbi:MAG: Gfo/Idh/MocA family oxidoreductase [Acidobacteria bacterium]|nr:Gfo/Idh/MocA family oxidoreductase [Acidobacteriota bacterium]